MVRQMDRRSFNVIRGALICGMVFYHLLFDLEYFVGLKIGVLEYPVLLLQRTVALGLLGLFGVVSVKIGWDKNKILKRFLKLALVAAGITVVTRIAEPENTIYFGIIHLMAVSSLLVWPFLKLKNQLGLALGLVILVWGFVFPVVGGQTWDFFPLLPWSGAVLIGISLEREKILANINFTENKLNKILEWCGVHSLAIYLVHQPILVGMIWIFLAMTNTPA